MAADVVSFLDYRNTYKPKAWTPTLVFELRAHMLPFWPFPIFAWVPVTKYEMR